MLAVEDVLSELAGDEGRFERGLPPGFRFHPTDEELVTFYLASKVFNGGFCTLDIAEVDLNRCEPWELPEMAKMGDREWYFFSVRDRKYPTGLRTNRATAAGYWKATGKDKEVYSGDGAGGGGGGGVLVGMKKTLVFYKGRAPRGVKSRWVMHEYRLDGRLSLRGHSRKEEWVICRVYHKTADKKSNGIQQGQICNYNNQQPNSEPPFAFSENHANELEKTLIDPTVPSTNNMFCKPETVYVSTVDDNSRYPNPLIHLAGYELLELSAAAEEVGVMSAALDKSGFHMMLDSPIRFPPEESWPFVL